MRKRNFLKLRRLIEDADLSHEELAAQANIGKSTLSKKLGRDESEGEWSWKEIVAICTVLSIPQEKIGEYFFPKVKKGESE